MELAYKMLCAKLHANDIYYTEEREEDLIRLYLDIDKIFICLIDMLGIKIIHFYGGMNFNLDESLEHDVQAISDAFNYIQKIRNNDIYQIEIHKFGKIVSARQHLLIDGKEDKSGVWVMSPLFFIPFLPKEVKEVRFRLVDNRFVEIM